jgi:AraC-like DNA-binding protein
MSNFLLHKQKKIGDYIVDYLGVQSKTFSRYEFLKSLQLVWPSLEEIDCLQSKNFSNSSSPKDKFVQKSKAYKFDEGVAIAFGKHSSSALRKKPDSLCSLILPIQGNYQIVESENRFAVDANSEQGIFLNGADIKAYTSDVEAIAVAFSPEKINKMMKHFAKNKNVKVPQLSHKLDFTTVRLNDLKNSFFQSINSAGYFGAFDQVTADMILRHTALMILVSMGEELTQRAFVNNARIIDKLCARLYSNLSETYTLTFMESFTGLSARVLQKEFNKRFGLSPFAWLNEQRLFRARELLLESKIYKTVSEVSRDCGFSHLGRFSVSFKNKFGTSANSFKNNN